MDENEITQDETTRVEEDPSADLDVDPELLDTSRYRLTDKQALGLLVGWLVFRAVMQRIGLAYLPRLGAGPFAWVVPLTNSSMVALIGVGALVDSGPPMFAAVAAATVFLTTIAGLILYWAGWRFGPVLAKKAEEGHMIWQSVWNPKQVARAHRWIERYGIPVVAFGRFFEWFTAPIMLVAGSVRMTLWKFLFAHTLGAIGFAAGTLWVGSRAAIIWPWLPDRIQAFAQWSLWIALGLVGLLVLLYALNAATQGAEDKADSSAGGPES